MNLTAPFNRQDLEDLDERFLSRASAVVSLREVHAGNKHPNVIGLRHDCDSAASLATAVDMAEWEADRGYRSTYFILHTSGYWCSHDFRESLEMIAMFGHEIGIHTNALAESFRTGVDPDVILLQAIGTLRALGHTVRGVAGHGDPFCNRNRGHGEGTFANDEQFVECARPQEGDPDREVTRGAVTRRIQPRPLADFGLDYEALVLGLPRHWRVSDSGGRWKHVEYEPSFDEAAAMFGSDPRQLHMLVHPDWWADAFASVAVAA